MKNTKQHSIKVTPDTKVLRNLTLNQLQVGDKIICIKTKGEKPFQFKDVDTTISEISITDKGLFYKLKLVGLEKEVSFWVNRNYSFSVERKGHLTTVGRLKFNDIIIHNNKRYQILNRQKAYHNDFEHLVYFDVIERNTGNIIEIGFDDLETLVWKSNNN